MDANAQLITPAPATDTDENRPVLWDLIAEASLTGDAELLALAGVGA